MDRSVPVSERVRRWLPTVAQSALLFAWLLSFTVAITGSVGAGIGGAIGSAFGSFLIARGRDQEFRQLDRHEQQVVRDVISSGVASGELALDRIALRRLGQRARGTGTAQRIWQAVTVVLLVIGPVAASARAGTWWLLCLIPAAMFWWWTLRADRGVGSADVRLARLIRTPGMLEQST